MKLAGRSIGRRVIRLSAVAAFLLIGTAVAQQPHTLTGDIRFHKGFHSNILNNDRDVVVYLPPGYESHKDKRYSVFYLHDGQNLFDGATSFIPGQEWRADETAQSLIAAGKVEPLIIVGIYNTGKDRIEEYTPAADTKYKIGGKADLYGRLLVEELKPFIDTNYRTLGDARHTGLGGSSLGGLVSFVVSPSVWWANNYIIKYVEAEKKRPPIRIWLDIGTKEGGNAEEAQKTLEGSRLLKVTLVRKGWQLEKDLKYFEAEGAEHNERAWAARFESILEFLFPRKG